MLPFRLRPVYKYYLWGGTKLITDYGKHPDNDTLAESWELASHKDGDSVILDGECTGLTLSEAVREHPAIVSSSFRADETFPILVKMIDAKQPLSIQVHPFNDYARRVEHSKGKTEAWYILEHDEGAFIYLGFAKNVSRREFEQAIMNNTLPEILRKVYVKDNDMFFIPAGTIHAIGAGITLAEFQENSNITYRVYDYGRRDKDGNTRELHIAKALDVTNTFPLNITPPGQRGNVIVSCNKFHVERVKAPYSGRTNNDSFKFLMCIEGMSEFRCGDVSFELVKGENVFVPADCENEFSVDGDCEVLITSL